MNGIIDDLRDELNVRLSQLCQIETAYRLGEDRVSIDEITRRKDEIRLLKREINLLSK
jgi:hypothetical protein